MSKDSRLIHSLSSPDFRIWHLNASNSESNMRHREDGPAIERADGVKEWYLNGKRHRLDGPAVEDVNGFHVWYINGVKLKATYDGQTNYYIDEKPVSKKEAENHYKKYLKICKI